MINTRCPIKLKCEMIKCPSSSATPCMQVVRTNIQYAVSVHCIPVENWDTTSSLRQSQHFTVDRGGISFNTACSLFTAVESKPAVLKEIPPPYWGVIFKMTHNKLLFCI